MSSFSYVRDAMGYKERSTWIELVVAVGVFLWYLAAISGRVRGTPIADVAFQGPMIRATLLSIVATIVLHFAYAIVVGSRDTQEDQRDRQVARFRDGEMTQAELAERVGVTRQTIIAIEQGRYSPSLEVAFRIARVFGVPLEEAFQYPDDRG